jgi:hypothetical protein
MLICRGTDTHTHTHTDTQTHGRTKKIYSIFRDKLLLLGEHVLFTILLFTVLLDFCMLPYSAAPLLAIFKISHHIAYNILFTILLFMYITILSGTIGWWRIYLGRNSLHTDGRRTTI